MGFEPMYDINNTIRSLANSRFKPLSHLALSHNTLSRARTCTLTVMSGLL